MASNASAGAHYSDNPRSLVDQAQSDGGLAATAALEVSRETETTRMMVKPELRSYRYRDDTTLDRDDQYARAALTALADRQHWSIDLGYSRESTLTSELESTGRVQANKRRISNSVAPAWSLDISDRLALRLDIHYSDVRYEDAERTGLVDYSAGSLGAGISGELSETQSWSLSIYDSALRARDGAQETLSYGWMGQYDQALDDTLMFSASIGTRRSEYEYSLSAGTLELADDGWLASASLRKEWENSSLQGALSRSVDPSGTGSLQQRDRFVLRWGQQLSAGLSAHLSADLSHFTYLRGTANDEGRDFDRFDAALRWQVAAAWSLEAGYSYIWQRYDGTDIEVSAHNINLMVSWRDEMHKP